MSEPMTPERLHREGLSSWMMAHGFTTGHGDTFDDLLVELSPQCVVYVLPWPNPKGFGRSRNATP